MAESGGNSDNPFSFKTFVKSKQETKGSKQKKKQEKQNLKNSPLNPRKGEISSDESPFPEVTKPGNGTRFKLKS